MRARGMDISHYQGDFKYKGNRDFIIIKATEGWSWTDPRFEEYLPEVQRVPIRGAYHYFRTGMDPLAQADFFWRTVKDHGFHFLAVDYEKTNNTLDEDGELNLWAFWLKLASLSNIPVVLYTSPYIFRDNLCKHNKGWESVPLWMAHWNGLDQENGSPTVFDASGWLLWQWTNAGLGSMFGVSSDTVDLDVYNGTVEEMRVRFIKENVMPKKAWTSKTIIFFILSILVAVAGYFGFADFQLSGDQAEILTIIVSVIGIILRFITKEPVEL
jgi:GH25 family lysozyme M1 (1,4-beta-N-acetylmuramidase)